MKPVAIFRHSPLVAPGYFLEFLNAQAIPWCLIPVDEGASIPTSPSQFSGLCFMGGPMSVNDPLAWIAEELRLIRDAVAMDLPVIGHCLGGQLLSRALGGQVTRNPVQEIGWSALHVERSEQALDWLGTAEGSFPAYQWHGETFSLPEKAVRLMTNDFCVNQVFVQGPHLGMQCHVEMTKQLIEDWIRNWAGVFEDGKNLTDSVQPPELQLQQLQEQLARMRVLSARLYTRWAKGLHGYSG